MMIGQRVDALVLAYRASASASTRLALRQAVELAQQERSPVPVELGRFGRMAVSPRQPQGAIVASSAAWSVRWSDVPELADRSGPGWEWQVECRAQWLAERAPADAASAARWAVTAASDAPPIAERCRRIDLATDWTAWPLHSDDVAALVVPRRGRVAGYVELDQEHAEAEQPEPSGAFQGRAYHRSGRCTGFTVCPGSPIMLRAYDKTEHLQALAVQVADAERARWAARGWESSDRVTRVEAQWRGDALAELGLRDDVPRLLAELGGVWAYTVRDWCRLVLPGTASRLHRCELDPRWAALQAVEWGELRPLVRRRVRGRADYRQAWGVACSYLGDRLPADPPAELAELLAVVGSALVHAWAGDALAHAGAARKMALRAAAHAAACSFPPETLPPQD